MADKMEVTETEKREESAKEIKQYESMPPVSSPRGKESSKEVPKEQHVEANPIPIVGEEGEDKALETATGEANIAIDEDHTAEPSTEQKEEPLVAELPPEPEPLITEKVTPSTTKSAAKCKRKSEVEQLSAPKPRKTRSSKKQASKEKQVLESLCPLLKRNKQKEKER